MLRYVYQPLHYDDSIRILLLHPSLNESDPITITIQNVRLSDVNAKSSEWSDTSNESNLDSYDGSDISAKTGGPHSPDVKDDSHRFVEDDRSSSSDEPAGSEDIDEANDSSEHNDTEGDDRIYCLPCLVYEALSYTWGDPGGTNTIHFSDSNQTLVIGNNCYSALQRLRRKDAERFLWIDAICINQDDIEERSRQVRIMDRVFDLATTVVVYLGEQVTECHALFAELAVVDELLTHGEYQDGSRERPSALIVKELDALFGLPWFKRVWVLQEVCGKQSVLFMYGSAIASPEALWKLYFGYNNHAVTTRPLALYWIFLRPEEDPTPQMTLWRWLFRSRECLATDPRDRVFALKAMVGSMQGQMDALIDYTQSVTNCFTEVAFFLLPVLHLRLLLAVRHPHRLEMNSWIPDWSQNLPLDCYEQLGVTTFQSVDEQHYEIERIPATQDSISLELRVTGCRYAKVACRSLVFSFRDPKDCEAQMRSLYKEIWDHKAHEGIEYHLTCKGTAQVLGQEILDAMAKKRDNDLHYRLHRAQCGTTHDQYLDSNSCPSAYGVEESLQSLHQCRIVLLDNGELAIAPADVLDGDVVVAILGTFTPCLLRSNAKGYWTLISGDCALFTEDYRPSLYSDEFMCANYIEDHAEEKEIFAIR